MTKQRDFKALVRERMAKTGERYTAARAHLLAKPDRTSGAAEPPPGVLDGYDRFGGIQSGTAAVHNVLRHAGIISPLTRAPYGEAMVDGLCGGPGFLYAVFEYKGWPPMLSLALHSRSMPDVYVAAGLPRLGVRMTQSETTSPATARRALDAALSAGKAALCVTDIASLPWYGLPKEFVGGGPHVVAIVGRDGESFWVDDRRPRPIRVSANDLAAARAAYRHARNRLITIDGPEAGHDASDAIRDAIAGTAKSYVEPAVPKSFRVNCGFSGLDKWHGMLTDRKDKKGWPTVFPDGAKAFAGLQRTYESLECQSAPDAGRRFYAGFLEEAAAACGRPLLQSAATTYREAGALWGQIAGLIANCQDAAVRQACEISNRRLELGDASRDDVSKESAELWRRRHTIAGECRLTKAAALGLYADMATLVGRIADAERAAVDQLHAALRAF